MAYLPPLLVDIPRNPIFAVGLPVALGSATGFLTRRGPHSVQSAWYKSLAKPSFQPPPWTFGVVWPALYVAMGYASHLTVKALDRTPPGLGRDQAKHTLALYYGQLALNMAWSPLMFAAGSLSGSLAGILALDAAVVTWALNLRKVSRDAALLTVPYLAWLGLATAINASVWFNNGGRQRIDRGAASAKDAGNKAAQKAGQAKEEAKDAVNDATK